MKATEVIPSVAKRLIDAWLPAAHAAVGDQLISAVLFGSVALGDFAPRWSDIDVCLVVHDEAGLEVWHDVESVSHRIHQRFVGEREGEWISGQAVESTVVTRADAKAPDGGSLAPFDRLLLAQRGAVLSGESVTFAPPSRAALLGQLERQLASLQSIENRSPIWMTGMLADLARAIVFWRDGEEIGKGPALNREIAASSPFADAFRVALKLRHAGSTACADHHEELRELLRIVVAPATEELRRLSQHRWPINGETPRSEGE